MLAGVLLHVVEAPLPVDLGRHRAGGDRVTVEHVPDPAAVLGLDVDDARGPEPPAIRLLASTLGEEVGRRQLDRRAARVLAASDDLGVEARGVRVVVVAAVRAHERVRGPLTTHSA